MEQLTDVINANPDGLVIDLRGSVGGYLRGAVNVLERFVAADNLLLTLPKSDTRFIS
jgi:C-terminal processing protease CtpA/Prc